MITFSLVYDDKYYKNTELNRISVNTYLDNEIKTTQETYLLDCIKITREHRRYKNGLEYSLCYFENVGKDNSKQIKDIWDLDCVFTNDTSTLRGGRGYWGGDETTQIHITTGCNNRFNEYRPYCEPIGPKGNYYSTVGGRSSEGLLPFFEIRNENAKVATMISIGWSAQWRVFFDKTTEGNNRICAGIQNLDFYLKPSEKIRTASVLVYDYTGDRDVAHNVWRECLRDNFCLEHKFNGSMIEYGSWGGQSDEYLIEKAKLVNSAGLKFDIANFDAGWYGNCPDYTSYVWDDGNEHSGLWAEHVGDWKVNTILHPTYLKEVLDEYRKIGRHISLWSEFERAHKNSDTAKEHPEYYFETMIGSNYIVNLGSEKGYNYAWESINYIPKNNLGDVIALDFNVDPLEAFLANDEENRKGISEIKYIMGLYSLFEKYNAVYPNSFITNTSSGGRRMDIEMMQRTLEKHRSDTHCAYDFPCNNSQSHGAVLSYWMPYTTTTITERANEKYRFRSSYASGMTLTDFSDFYNSENIKEVKKNFDEYLSIKKYADKDFYPIFGFSREESGWGGWQYHDKNNDSGIIMAFRRKESLSDTVTVNLKGLSPNAKYCFYNVDSNEKSLIQGEKAMQSYKIVLSNKNDCCLIKYVEVKQ